MYWLILWHFLVHIFGVDYGFPYGHWCWYDFWSGVAGSFLVGIAVYAGSHWAHGTCHHSRWCFRKGKHPAAGGTFKLCWKHHPDMGEKPHPDMIARLHREWAQNSGQSR